MDVTANAVSEVMRRRDEIVGLRFTYEPEVLRFFQARFDKVVPQTTGKAKPPITREEHDLTLA